MSPNFQKELFQKKLQTTIPTSKVEEDADDSADETASGDTVGELISSSSSKSRLKDSNHDLFTKLPTWSDYFDFNESIEIQDRGFQFNTYYALPKNLDTNSIPIFFFHHGAGSSGLTFAPLVKELVARLNGTCGAVSFDARGHGSTRAIGDGASPAYDLDTFTYDFAAIMEHFLNNILSKDVPVSKLSIVLVGHSLGGSICTAVVPKLNKELSSKVVSVAMFDIVEEVAVAALEKMDHFLDVTPNSFRSMREAIEYHIKHGLSNLRSSAEILVPSLFTEQSDGSVTRITNLRAFAPYWDTWFKGLSSDFTKLPVSKMLLLAGSDKLDRELIIGQMQGKFQLIVFQDSGHFIQEDVPYKTAIALIDFWRRNDNKNIVIQTNWGRV
ncbi:HCL405Cp [Eremothecium sinecaudum]|uniref:Protein phosphatase methylesterase 1 n=1 Tax=Eremothecium sinecaudum TaxID=45286 RepID=A0A109UWB0_9SACH|nr:HCL405Cp [Eremothecium sinecaudum]AMD19746.1 HCL405Cp [Eremothecium sinecaudum]